MDTATHDWKRTYRNIVSRMKDDEGRYRVKTDGPEAALNVAYSIYRHHGGEMKREAFKRVVMG